jgi:hypothetical protein
LIIYIFIEYFKKSTVKKIFILFLFSLPFYLSAQKSVDLDAYHFSVKYRSLPAIQIDSTYHTYNVEVETTKLMDPLLNEMEPGNSVRIEGWRKLPEGGHLSVKVKLGDLIPGDVSVKERVVTTKTGNGLLTGSKTFYYEEVVYTFEAEAVITDYKEMHIMDQPLASRSYKKVYHSPEFAFKPLAEGYFLVNSLAVTKELYRESVNQAMQYLDERLTANFGFDEVTAEDKMWVIGSRKHPEYDEWRQAIRQINDVLFDMNASTPITHARQDLQPAINYFEKIKRDYSSSSRHDRKIRYGSYYNLAVLYYYLDDPQAMMKEANGLELNDFDSNDAKGFKQTASWLKNLFEHTNIYTRHFPMNPEIFKGPFEKTDLTIK